MNWTYLGFLAGILTTIGFLPQVIKSYKSKSAKDVSLRQPLLLLAGMLLWLVYGIHLQDWAIMLANTVSIALNICIVILKISYDYRKPE
jgi:MtN3 and saliva related transmembrane protein